MRSLLYLTNDIPEYRDSFLKGLSKYFDLTVLYYGKTEVSVNDYKIEKVNSFSLFGFVFFGESIFNRCQNFDVVLVMGHSRVPQYTLLALRSYRNFSLTYWGLEVSCSYRKEYGKDRKWDFIRVMLLKRAESALFYIEEPRKRYIENFGFESSKIFVANNTVEVSPSYKSLGVKSHFLFVGTLYKEKNIDLLLKAYEMALKINPNISDLLIIGDGPERVSIESFIVRSGLERKIKLLGAIYDQSKLDAYFGQAIATISPGQAGLSVLASLGRGVPFITSINSITGGERFNIIDGYNGFLLRSTYTDFADVIVMLSLNKNIVENLSRNSRDYYINHASMDQMIFNAKCALEYAYRTKKEPKKRNNE